MMRGEQLPKHMLIKDYSYMLFIEGTMLLSLFLVCIGKQERICGAMEKISDQGCLCTREESSAREGQLELIMWGLRQQNNCLSSEGK